MPATQTETREETWQKILASSQTMQELAQTNQWALLLDAIDARQALLERFFSTALAHSRRDELAQIRADIAALEQRDLAILHQSDANRSFISDALGKMQRNRHASEQYKAQRG